MTVELSPAQRALLAAVDASGGRWDTRGIDFEYYRRSQEPIAVLDTLRELEVADLVAAVDIPGGTGPGWRLTSIGREALEGGVDTPG